MGKASKFFQTALVATFALSLLAVGLAWAGPGRSTENGDNSFWKHMNEMRQIMHFGEVTAEPTANGVRVTVTSQQPALAKTIQQEFSTDHPNVQPPFPAQSMEVASVEKGVAIIFSATDPDAIAQLQNQGAGMFYILQRNNMHALMSQSGGNPNGQGFGPGAMHQGAMGSGMRGQGFGPGAMHQGAMGTAPLDTYPDAP